MGPYNDMVPATHSSQHLDCSILYQLTFPSAVQVQPHAEYVAVTSSSGVGALKGIDKREGWSTCLLNCINVFSRFF